MLQQTQAARVAVVYPGFLRRFPTVVSLARASRATVLRAWGDLGYNRRAIALSEAARMVLREHGGRFPHEIHALDRLPGVGPYTAAAVAALAFGEPVAAVDTNVQRVVARVHLGAEGHESAPAEIASLAASWVDRRDPSSWNQALMDLGRQVCRPRPRCDLCPLARVCRFRAAGATPRPSPRRQGPFEGSTRQVRGAVVRALRDERSATLGGLARLTGFDLGRVAVAVSALAADGVVEAGRAARAGRPGGRVRLAS